MSIDKEKSNILKHNYGIFFKGVLTRFRVQQPFVENEIKIGINRWYSLCEGKTFKNANITGIISKTGINAAILRGQQKMRLYKDSEDEKCEEGVNFSNEINSLIEDIKKNNEHINSIEVRQKYNEEFLKLVRYALSLTDINVNSPQYKIDKVLGSMKNIKSDDYKVMDLNDLDRYCEILMSHIEVIKSLQVIKSFDNKNGI